MMDKIRSYFFSLLNILRNICSDYRSKILISQLAIKWFLVFLTRCVTYLNIFIIPLENISITSPFLTSINSFEIIAFVPKWHFSYYSIIILFFNKLRSEKTFTWAVMWDHHSNHSNTDKKAIPVILYQWKNKGPLGKKDITMNCSTQTSMFTKNAFAMSKW